MTVQLHQEDTASNLLDNPDADFDIVSLVESAYDADTNTVRDLKVDDRDLPKAKNFYDYCLHYLGPTAKVPFARQMWMGYKLLAEYCVSGDTLLLTSRGLRRIDDLVGANRGLLPVSDLRVATRLGSHEVTYGGKTGTQTCLTIKVRGEIPLTVTPNHKVLVLSDTLDLTWVKAKHLSPGDWLVSPSSVDLWPKKVPRLPTEFVWDKTNGIAKPPVSGFKPLRKVTPELAKLVGYLITDGSFCKQVGFINENRAIIKDFASCLGSVFGLSAVEISRKRRKALKQRYPTMGLGNWANQYLQFLGLKPGRCYTKELPWFILQAPRHLVIACLRAMFDSDGFISRHRVGIELSSVTAVRQIHLLMKNLGIEGNYQEFEIDSDTHPCIKVKTNREGKNQRARWQACTKHALKMYAEVIGSTHSEKRRTLAKLLRLKTPNIRIVNGQYGVVHSGNIPQWDSPYVKRCLAPTFYHESALSISTCQRKKTANLAFLLSHPGLARRLSKTEDRQLLAKKLVRLSELGYRYVKVTSVEDAIKQPVYDITVPVNESFLANGIIVHNCPRCSNPKWENIYEVPVDYNARNMPEHVQFLENGVCPKCKWTKSKLIRAGLMNLYSELDVCAGQRSGKSAYTAALSTYITHLHLKNPRLATLCDGIQESTPLTATFVGIRFDDAYKLLWTPILEIMDASPWFNEYHALLNQCSEKYGKELLKKRDVYVRYAHKNIDLFPMSSNKRALRGRTRFLGAVDEIGWFPLNPNAKADEDAGDGNSDRERADGEEVYTSLDRSMLTVRAEVHRLIHVKGISTIPTAINVLISSPASAKDKISRLVEQNKHSKSALAVHLPTWEMNPNLPEDHPIIRKAYHDNPSRAERDYGAKPPKSINPYMANPDIKANFKGMNRATAKIVDKNMHGTHYRGGMLNKVMPENDIPPAILSVDAGYSNNSFGLTLMYKEALKIVVPVLIEIQPSQGAVLHYNAIWKGVIVPLIQQFNVQLLLADRWQSLALLHRAQDELGIKAAVYSVKRRDFDLVKSKFESQEFVLPSIEADISDDTAIMDYPSAFTGKPAAHLFFQCMTVRDMGKTVVKGDGYTDDLFRALVLGASRAFDPKVIEYLATRRKTKRGPVALGSMIGLTSGGMTSTSRAISAARAIPRIASVGMLSRR